MTAMRASRTKTVPGTERDELAAFAPIVEAVAAPLMLTDARGNIRALNRAMRERPGVAAGATVRALMPAYDEALTGRYDRHASVLVTRMHQSQFVQETLHCEPFAGGACITIEDRTRQAELESAHAQTTRLASLGFMVAGVCHEVANPLAAVSSMVQLMRSRPGGAVEPMLERGLASIAANVARVLAITRKLGDFSRVAGDAPQPIAVGRAMEEAIELLRHDRCASATRIDYRGTREEMTLAQPGEVQQVLFNVLLNAAQATGGAGRIECETVLDGQMLRISIRDDGPGILPEHLGRVFEPFFTTKPAGTGTGLGLAISSEIVHALGGRITAENDPRGGARIVIELPRHRVRDVEQP